MLTVAHIQPIVSLVAGILILVMPQLLNYIVAIYLIVRGHHRARPDPLTPHGRRGCRSAARVLCGRSKWQSPSW